MTPAELHAILRHRDPSLPPVIYQHDRTAVATPLPAVESPLERKFLELWTLMDGPKLERELRFAPPRRWRFDFADPATQTAIELEGGVYGSQGRHVRPKGFQADAEKYNHAALLGWAVFRLTGRMVTREGLQPILDRVKQKDAVRSGL